MKYSPLILLLTSTVAWSEISSLTAEELTDTYIKDTTVIVRPQKSEPNLSEDVSVSLKVSPIEKATQVLPQDNEQTLSTISPHLNTYTDLNNQAALSNNLATLTPPPTTSFLRPGPQEGALADIIKEYGSDVVDPTDLTTLGFLQTLPADRAFQGRLPTNTDLTANGNSFTLRIPNLGNFNSQNFATPNGEVGVNVTPNHIEYTVNLPK